MVPFGSAGGRVSEVGRNNPDPRHPPKSVHVYIYILLDFGTEVALRKKLLPELDVLKQYQKGNFWFISGSNESLSRGRAPCAFLTKPSTAFEHYLISRKKISRFFLLFSDQNFILLQKFNIKNCYHFVIGNQLILSSFVFFCTT